MVAVMSDALDISCCLKGEEEEEAAATGRSFRPLLGYKSPLTTGPFLYHSLPFPPKFQVIFIICMKSHNDRSQLGNILSMCVCVLASAGV